MKNTKYIFIFFYIIFIMSCCSIEQELEGTWIITSMYKKSNDTIYDITKDLRMNILRFNQYSVNIYLPAYYVNDSNSAEEIHRYKITNDKYPFEIILQGKKTSPYNGFYDVLFEKLNNEKLQLQLVGDSIYIICTKESIFEKQDFSCINTLKKR